jgi:YVTN family beta-propeller protein
MKTFALFLTFILVISFHPSYSQAAYKVEKEISVTGDGSWDYLSFDQEKNRLFISHGTMVQVLDLATDQVTGVIPNTIGVHGIALVPESAKGYISAGKLDSVIVFDYNTLQVLKKIKTGQNPDAIIYDPVTRRVFAFNGKSNDVTAIDVATDAVAGTIKLPGKPEFAVPDGNGKMFVNIEDKGTIVKFDARSLAVEATWPLAPGTEPTGLAMDRKNNRLFSACSGTNQLVVLNPGTGKVDTTLAIGSGCDGLIFIPESHEIITSNGEGNITVIHQKDVKNYSVIATIATKKSARTIAFNPMKKVIYLPAADVKTEDGKRIITPGSFKILVVSRNINRVSRP